MYFDSWSSSYFFWVVICFSVWGMVGFSIYGAINVLASRRNKHKKDERLLPGRIQELKWKAEKDAAFFAYEDERQRQDEREYEKDKEETIKFAEVFANSIQEKDGEAEEISPETLLWPGKEMMDSFSSADGNDPAIEQPEREKTENEKLKEIYEKEIKGASESYEEDITEQTPGTRKPAPEQTFIAEEKSEKKGKRHWKEIDDVFRMAFRR